MMRVAVISDTHGLLRPEVEQRLAGVDHILHAGDLGSDAVLERLEAIAPLTAVRGNIDKTGRCAKLPEFEVVELEGKSLYMLHNMGDLDLNPAKAGFSAVIYGHSHTPEIVRRGTEQLPVIYLNPGSCGPRRFNLPVSIALLSISGAGLDVTLDTLLL